MIYRKCSQKENQTLNAQKCSKSKNCMKLQECSKNAKPLPPPPRKLRLSRDLSRKNAKLAVKFTASRLRGLLMLYVLIKPE